MTPAPSPRPRRQARPGRTAARACGLGLLLAFAALSCRDGADAGADDGGPDPSGGDGPGADDGGAPDAPVAPGLFRVVFFSVGTGDSTLIQAPGGRTLLIDLGVPQVVADGHEADAARHVVDRVAALTGRRAVDYFLASHFHSDHVGAFRSDGAPIGGIAWAVESLGFAVGTFLDRGREPAGDSPTQGEYLRWAEERRNRTVVDGPGDRWVDLGPDVRVDVLAAAGAGAAPAGSGENGLSLAVRVTFGDVELAAAGDLTGDCEEDFTFDVETALAAAMGVVEAYKVNHHGSQSSSNLTWVRALRPTVSVFPAGTSRFGYPHERVVDALGAVGDLYYTRTGDVTLESRDGRSFTVAGRSYAARGDADEARLPDPPLGVDEKTDALCDNRRDDDDDGYTDCADYSCSQCAVVTVCD